MSDQVLLILQAAREKMIADYQKQLADIDRAILERTDRLEKDVVSTEPRTPKPFLNNLRIADAVHAYLTWADKNGLKVNMGDLERELANWGVRASKGELLGKTSNPWKTLSNVLGSPKNAQLFKIHKSRRNISRSDVIELATQQQQAMAG